ncbi:hypothetical protein LBMAG53_04320 [Planctomycetota bacterium]|nr:hypothetical protein LBMAG53_04320 [Planctomycetota bacterium]
MAGMDRGPGGMDRGPHGSRSPFRAGSSAVCALLLIAGIGAAELVPAGQAQAAAGQPGRAIPAGAAPIAAWTIRWDDYRTILVSAPGAGRIGPGWVLTYHLDPLKGLAVAYRAKVFRDANGAVHFDAREARIVGPMANQWSPDSFSVAGRQVVAIDDHDRGNTGALESVAPETGNDYLKQLRSALAVIQNGL